MSDVTPEATAGQAAYARWHAFRWPGTPALRATQAAGEWDVLSDQDRAAWEAAAEEPYKAGYAAGIAAGLDQAVAENASLRAQLLRTEEQCRRHVNQADAERDAEVAYRESMSVDWHDDVQRLEAERDAARERIAAALKLIGEAKPGLSALCTCYDCERYGDGSPGYEDYVPHPGRVLSWKLDPAAIREALGEEPR